MKKIATAAACMAACLSGAAAAAQPDRETVVTGTNMPTAIVRYGDLNLDAPAGIAALNERVHRAATRLCIEPGLQPAQWMGASLACHRDAVASARPQIDAAIASYAGSSQIASAALVIRAAR